ncbi:MAG: TRAP transporter substrate-binding protein DctP [Bacteroidetes bacterium]|nr:TRAP transporter substrate-binding protein DctP [Bacteroidota bacterium]
MSHSLFLAILCGLGVSTAQAQQTIKLGTLYPKTSDFGTVLETWAKTVKEKSGGQLELQIFYNGSQGDESSMAGKIKSGQLDGAFFTGSGLSKFYKPVAAMEMPGLFNGWAALDKTRDSFQSEFTKGLKDAGLSLIGWCDPGKMRCFSNGFAITQPADFRGKKPFQWRDNVIFPEFYKYIGSVSTVQLNTPEVLPNLNTGAINTLICNSYQAESMQWGRKLTHVNASEDAYSIGALTLSQKKLDALTEELRQTLITTGATAAKTLMAKLRAQDDAAYNRLKSKMTVTTHSEIQRKLWEKLYAGTRKNLVTTKVFSADLVTRMERIAANK